MPVYLLLLGPHGVNAFSKLLSLGVVGELALHPDKIGEWSISKTTVNGTLGATLEPVVTLTGARRIPVEVDVLSSDVLGDRASFKVALALSSLQVLINEGLLVRVGTLVDGLNDGIVEKLQASLSNPLVFDSLKLVSLLSSLFGRHHEIHERLDVGVGRADDEGMVTVIDGRGDESSSFGVGSGNGKKIGAWG